MIVTNPLDGDASGINYSSLIERVQQLLMSGDRENLNQIGVAVSTDTNQINLAHPVKGIVTGTTINVGVELMYVWDISSTGTLTVQRGYGGSTIADHAAGDLVSVNPRFSRFAIGTAINDELRALSGKGLFQMKAVELLPSPAVRGYDFGATDLIDIYDVSYSSPVGSDWVRIPSSSYDVRHLADETFPSGNALFLDDVFYPNRTVRVLYKAGFVPLVESEDDVQSDGGLHSEANDLLVLGAAIRISAPQEIRRNQLTSQGDTRRAGEVPPGALARSYGGLAQEYSQRLVEERHRLLRKFPVRIART